MHIPSLQTLRAFEAAGRHQSYSRAADELGLTHGAISHRIRDLELLTGGRLFQRQGNRMLPTSEGHRLLAQVRNALSLLEDVFRTTPRGRAKRLVISVIPSLASHWLISKVGEFRTRFPEVDLVLKPSAELDVLGEGIDGAIRYGPGGWPNVQGTAVCDELLFPVCSPAYRDRHPIERPEDLKACTLLRHPWQPWAKWLRAARLDIREPKGGPEYSDSGLIIQAAIAGEGVALARGLVAADELRSGTLVRPFELAVRDTYRYFVVQPQGVAQPLLGDFISWLTPKMVAAAADMARGLTIGG
jgi:LysR family glycine cleavage system transcriptional activator